MHLSMDTENDSVGPAADKACLSLEPANAQLVRSAAPPLLPEILERSHLEQYRDRFFEEYMPVGPTETAIVGDMARQAAAMERWAEVPKHRLAKPPRVYPP